MRLIDADAMKESIRMQTAFIKLIGGEFAEIAETLEKGFLQEIDNAPTIDAVPVVRGTWRTTLTGWVYCSVCGSEPPDETNERTPYCSWCGAKMDRGEDDE